MPFHWRPWRSQLLWGGGTPSLATEAVTQPATTAAATAAETDAAASAAAVDQATTDQATSAAETGEAAADTDAAAKGVATVTVDGTTTSYNTLADAVAAANKANGATFTLAQNVDDYQLLTFTAPVNVTAADGVSFSGTIRLTSTAAGSTVKDVDFKRLDGREGNFNSVELKGVSKVEVSGNTFNSPSALGKVSEWQYNGVWVDGKSSDITVADNQFSLGRLNDTNGTGDVAVDSNANTGVNLVGGGDGNIHDVTLSGNNVTVGKAASGVALSGSIDLLVANGNATGTYGIKNVTLTGNTYVGSADFGAGTRMAGISNVDGFTFENNKVTDVTVRAVGQVSWQGNTSPNNDVKASGNTYVGVPQPAVDVDVSNTDVAATVKTDNGDVTSYETLDDAVAAANNMDSATVKLYKSVTDHKVYEFKKLVVVDAADGVTFNGQMRLNASYSRVFNVDFILDGDDFVIEGGKFKSGVQQNVYVASGANKVEIANNTFTIPSMYKGEVDFQPNSIWVVGSSSGVNIHDNKFNIGRAHNNSAVGINLVGQANVAIDGMKVYNNNFTGTKSADQVTSGNAMFLVANGNHTDGSFGITNLNVYDNVMDADVLSGVMNGSYGLSIGNVSGLTLTNNTMKGLYMGLSHSMWGVEWNANKTALTKLPAASEKIAFDGNTFEDVYAPVYFNALFDDGKGKPSVQSSTPCDQFTHKDGLDMKVDDISSYRNGAVKVYPTTPTGLVFVGWFSDEGLTKPLAADVTTGTAYAKYVPVSDIIMFRGAQLRMDNYVKDGVTDYTHTDLRLVYDFALPEGATYNPSDSGWNYGLGDDLSLRGTVSNYLENTDGTTRANIVLTSIGAASYVSPYSARAFVSFTTADGTTVSASDTIVGKRSVQQVAQGLVDKEGTPADQLEYANGILAAMKS